ncbi:MAG: RHS repeat-associated core domain-containing protein, partial [Coriobacteriia bacterium]
LSRSFSSFGEMDSESLAVAGAAVSSYALSRDMAGRIVSRVETLAGAAHALAYTYDTLGRLTLVTRDGGIAESYAFDGEGRRSAYRAPVRGVDETLALSYDADGRVLSCGAVAYTWDEDGRVLTRTGADGLTTYTHTAAGELSRVGLPDGRVLTYTYDGAGRRVAKAVDGVVSERYLIADDGRLLATYDGSGSLTSRFTYADARVPYQMTTPSGTYSLAFDQTGSLRAVATSGGVVVKTIDWDSFGNVTYDSAPGMRVAIGFAGGIIDEDTGLSHFGARDYDPALGRFTTPDPIDFSGGDTDLYAYCAGDPVGRVDPSGLACNDAGYGNRGPVPACSSCHTTTLRSTEVQGLELDCYANLQLTYPPYMRGWILDSRTGVHTYAGVARGTLGASVTLSTSEVRPGWYAAFDSFASGLAGGSLGLSITRNPEPFAEIGAGTPGWSLSVFRVR